MGSPGEGRFHGTDFYNEFLQNMAALVSDGVVVPLRMSSAGASMRQLTPNLVFLDGSHIYEDVLFDLTRWWGRLKRGGMMAIHDMTDATNPDVARAANTFVTGRKGEIADTQMTGSILWVKKK
jgi:hypothetical protein